MTARDCIKAVCQCVFFHRLFGQVVPREWEVLDTTVSCADDPDIDALIEGKAASFITALREYNEARSRGLATPHARGGAVVAQPAVCIEFFEKRKNKSWFSRAEEAVCWESWLVTCTFTPPARTDGDRRRAVDGTRTALSKALWCVVELMNRRNDEYIPSIPYGEGNPFPYQISITRDAA